MGIFQLHIDLQVIICLMLSVASCDRHMSGTVEGGDVKPLESNMIFNGNLSLFSYNRWPEYEPVNNNKRRVIISHLQDLHGLGTRESIWNSYGSVKPVSYGESFDFSYNDKVFRELSASGLRYCLQMKVDAVVANPDNYGSVWEKNAVWYIKMLAARYGSAPLYYCPMNEPDNPGQRLDGIPALDTDQIIRVQKVVYETLKGVDHNIMVASSPLCLLQDNNTYISSGRQVLLAGITEYCDYFAFHKHVDVGEDGRYSEMDLWKFMGEAEKAGHPARPSIVNENGTYLTLKYVYPEATVEDMHRFKAYWAGNDLIQMKALGLKYIVMYSLAGSLAKDGEYNLIDLNTQEGSGYKVQEPEYSAYRDLWNPYAHDIANGINGGFETPESDKSRGWVVSFRGRSFEGVDRVEPKEWDYVSIVPEGWRSGGYCLKMLPIDFKGTGVYDSKGITANRCRRLVEGLVPGRHYKISTWVKLEKIPGQEAPHACLKAMGYSYLGKTSEKELLYGYSEGKYVCLEVQFTAENPWVVISLEHNGKGFAFWDDVTISVQ